MASIISNNTIDLESKFLLMQKDARYDVANSMDLPPPKLEDIKQIHQSSKTLPKVPKIFLSNNCIFNCSYCDCRSSNECKQTYNSTPRELAELSLKVASVRGSGIFISSAIFKNANHTAELINETLRIIRKYHGYKGYIHAKVMPGTDPSLIWTAGQYANRLSVNIEVAKSEGYSKIAVNKNRQNILSPMGYISNIIQDARENQIPGFANSQTTQLMVGSVGEDDYTILNLSKALYKKYRLSRIYYTPFEFREIAAGYDLPFTSTPPWRVHRLYQADKLVQEYGFSVDEIVPQNARNLRYELDPKLVWAIRNLDMFPLEVNNADYNTLLRIPGIGRTYAKRILDARRYYIVTHDVLKKLGIPLKKSEHFLMCNGKFTGNSNYDSTVFYNLFAKSANEDCNQPLFFERSSVIRMDINRPNHA